MNRSSWETIQASKKVLKDAWDYWKIPKIFAADSKVHQYSALRSLAKVEVPPAIDPNNFRDLREAYNSFIGTIQQHRKDSRYIRPSRRKDLESASEASANKLVDRYRSSIVFNVSFDTRPENYTCRSGSARRLPLVISPAWATAIAPLYNCPDFGKDFFPIFLRRLHTDAEGVSYFDAKICTFKFLSHPRHSLVDVTVSNTILAFTYGLSDFAEGETVERAKHKLGLKVARRVSKAFAA